MPAEVPIRAPSGEVVGSIRISRLPSKSHDLRVNPDTGTAIVTEEGEYRFEVDMGTAAVDLEPSSELLSFDDASRCRGRLYPRQYVGQIRFLVSDRASDRSGWAEIDVRPSKLEAETEYRHMLRDIEDVATEAVLQGFAPAALSLHIDSSKRAELVYQQFALLYAKLTSSEFRNALALILANPHRSWVEETEPQDPGRPLRARGNLSRVLGGSGPRVPTHGRLSISSVPRVVQRLRTDSIFDSLPNQFVRYALSHWRGIAQRLADGLEAQTVETGPVRRGKQAAAEVLGQMDAYLATPLFRSVSQLRQFPAANQVLLKQAGYRDVFRTFALGELGALLALDLEVEDLFAASQRNVAALYEYWAFLQLADAVGQVCGMQQTINALRASDDLSLGFRQGPASELTWRVQRAGREFEIELFFNRMFLASSQWQENSSWSRAMRPDCSLRINPQTPIPQLSHPGDLDIWLHFDAKYRVAYEREQFGQKAADDEEAAAATEAEAEERLSRSRREDLLKMHAYRDAIRRSAGAYVLFPGNTTVAPFREFSEILPGLGAFILRPAATPAQSGRAEIERFLNAVLDHAADRATQYERERFWSGRIRGDDEPPGRFADLPDLALPPRDAFVLCGYVRSAEHAAWITRLQLYNVRADRRRGALSPDAAELQPEWVLLYGSDSDVALWRRTGAWFVQTRDQLLKLKYPGPGGSAYLCCSIARENEAPAWLKTIDPNSLRPGGLAHGHPFVTTWASLLGGADHTIRS